MKQQLEQWAEKFNALSLRERIILAVAVVVVLSLLWLELIYTGQDRATAALDSQLQTTRSQIAATNKQIVALTDAQTWDPDQANRQRVMKLTEQLAAVDEQLQQTMQGLISPSQMTQVLEAVLTQKTDLKLVSVRNLPTQPLLALPEDESGKSPEVGVYRHGMQIEFSGSYLSTLEYLKALKQLEWQFYWDSLLLEVKQYPISKVTIVVHTLSLKEGWIGV